MAKLEILEFPDPRLRTVAKPVETVDDALRKLIDDMIETMYEASGIGLAASQVNVHKRVLVIDVSETRDQPQVFINPEITPLTEELAPYEEGCLSVPTVFDEVERPDRIRVQYMDYDGNPVDEIAEGMYAVCIQHEMDHLEGVLFIDYLSRLKRNRAVQKVKKVEKAKDKDAA